MNDTPNTQPARLLDCGFCYEEQGEEVHPHPECPVGRVTPTRYRHRAEEIEAVQWTGSNADVLRAFCGPDFDEIAPEDRAEDPDQTAAVRTHPHGGWLGLEPGDWVLRYPDHFTATSDEAFRAVWEAVAVPAGRDALRDRIAEVDPELLHVIDAYLTATHTARHDVIGEGGTCAGCDLRDRVRRAAGELRRMADEAQQKPKAKPTVGYSGMGRVWCLRCTHPANENVSVNVDDLQPHEECAGCRRVVVDVARWLAEQPEAAASQPGKEA